MTAPYTIIPASPSEVSAWQAAAFENAFYAAAGGDFHLTLRTPPDGAYLNITARAVALHREGISIGPLHVGFDDIGLTVDVCLRVARDANLTHGMGEFMHVNLWPWPENDCAANCIPCQPCSDAIPSRDWRRVFNGVDCDGHTPNGVWSLLAPYVANELSCKLGALVLPLPPRYPCVDYYWNGASVPSGGAA